MSFLDLQGKTFLVFGVANRKSVAWETARILEAEGARVVYSVRSQARRDSLARLLEGRDVRVCDVERPEETSALAADLARDYKAFDGILHSIAFANYSDGFKPFHETRRDDFLQATAVSAFSLAEVANAFKGLLAPQASVVTIGISSTLITAENYGYMSPIKAALEGIVRNLAKSFSTVPGLGGIRFNSVNAGPLKTSASAGIPGYLENYLFAEKLTMRKRNIETAEVARTAVFLLSPASSGINAQGVVVNAGMDFNYFDKSVVIPATRI